MPESPSERGTAYAETGGKTPPMRAALAKILQPECIRGTGPMREGRPLKNDKVATRVLWQELHGPLEDHIILHHLCENIWCVNLDHLEPLDRVAHARAHGIGGSGPRTHCQQGHEYTPENTYVYPPGTVNAGYKRCLICYAAFLRRRNERTRTKYGEPDNTVVYATDGREAAKLHFASVRNPGMSGCGRAAINLDTVRPTDEAPAELRCRRVGCQERWLNG